MRRRSWWRALGAAALAAVACGCEEQVVTPPPVVPAQPPPPAGPADPLGAKPELPAAKPFEPPAPQMFKLANGLTIWLFERHTLPVVSATFAIPSGSSSDPKDQGGLASVTADMLDEGAGARNAVELSTAINDLGASLATGASPDGSIASLSVLKKNFGPAFQILGDVIARPRLEAKEWKRVSDLWKGALKKRADDPTAVSRVVARAVLYGGDTPYGHPPDGSLASAGHVDLPSIKQFYSAHWRPERGVLVVAGDVTRDELTRAAEAALGSWKAQGAAAPPVTPSKVRVERPRVVFVDRKDAPQSVIAVVREGVSATDPKAPLLDLVNTALGGSFTSRLNQNLREDHGWTYGARSGFTETRGQGWFDAHAAVVTEQTGPALKEMLGELAKMSAEGLSDEEFVKVKAQDRADLVSTYETVNSIAGRLGSLAMLSLPPDFDTAASRARQAAQVAQLKALASAVDPKPATIVVVGPSVTVLPQLAAIGLPAPERWDPEGAPLKAPR